MLAAMQITHPNGSTRCDKKLKQWPLPLRPDKMNSHQKGGRKPWGSRRSGGDPPTCFRCGQVGHLRIGCRNAQIDRNLTGGNTGRTPENEDRPLTRGSQRF